MNLLIPHWMHTIIDFVSDAEVGVTIVSIVLVVIRLVIVSDVSDSAINPTAFSTNNILKKNMKNK
jgi:hypothetical protein